MYPSATIFMVTAMADHTRQLRSLSIRREREITLCVKGCQRLKGKVQRTVRAFKHELECVLGNVGETPHILNSAPNGDA